MKNNIYVFGNFGYHKNNLNGQTVRTRTILWTLKKYLPKYNIAYTDTSLIKKSKFGFDLLKNFLIGLKNILFSNQIVVLPAQRSIRYVSPIVYYLKIILKKRIHFIAIGGWLHDYLRLNPKHTKYYRRMDCIYVQTNSLKKKLNEVHLNNVVHFPNYRLDNGNDIRIYDIEKVTKVVFFSRVAQEKGVELAIQAINHVNEELNDNIELHIFGPIREVYNDRFNRILNNSKNVFYKGIIEPEKILKELAQYDLMIFPTYYKGEGFPGAILDSLYAGVPVIASNWKYNTEIITDGYTGLIFETKDVNELSNRMEYLIRNPSIINKMKENCIEESKKYKESSVAPVLINNLRGKVLN